MPRAVWNDTVLGESDTCQIVEGNYYFPPGVVKGEHRRPRRKCMTCFWKGVASYFDVFVDGEVNGGVAWY